MRELNECKAEIFRRSEKRIRARRKIRRRLLVCCVPLCLMITLWSAKAFPVKITTFSSTKDNTGQPVYENALSGEEYPEEASCVDGVDDIDGVDCTDGVDSVDGVELIDSFSFSLTWDCYGISSYDSETGKLVKTKDAANPEDYITTCQLTKEQKQTIYDLILDLNVTAYPDTYNPHTNGMTSSPSMTLILSVKTDTIQKTITAENIAMTYESDNRKGQEFLSVCKAIRDILIETEEWKSLPDYEFTYS